MTVCIDEITSSVSAFKTYEELTESIVDRGYVPTVRPDSFEENEYISNAQKLRDRLIADGYQVFPPYSPHDKLPSKSINEYPADETEIEGYAKFNGGRHLCVDVPDGHYTISVRTSDGKRLTFAFVPYSNGHPAGCVDVMHHHDGETYNNSPRQRVIAFSGGGTRMHADTSDDKPVTLTSILLKD